jgi:N-acetylmuramoyl-L-alanine amidase
MTLNFKNIKYLVVHCSDTSDLDNLCALDIHNMHLNFGWDGIGYHKVICRNGTIEIGRPEYWIGAHAYNFNEVSLGVCLIGSKKFTKKQMISLKKILIEWKQKYINAVIIGHNELGNTKKTCPNFNVQEWCNEEEL